MLVLRVEMPKTQAIQVNRANGASALSLEPNVLAMEFSCTTPEEEVKRNITPEKWVCSTPPSYDLG